MPADFERCVRENPKSVWTEKLSGGKYRHVCRDKKGNKHYGHIKKKQTEVAHWIKKKVSGK